MEETDGSGLRARLLVTALEPNERRALDLIVDGYSLVQVVGKLGVSLEDAVRLEASVMEKLGARATTDLVRIGIYSQIDEE